MIWLLENLPELLRAKFALNEGASGLLDENDRPVELGIQAGEKVYQDFTLETANVGGHSARPERVNAINQLAAALSRIASYQFPIELNSTTRAYFEHQAQTAPSEVAADVRAILANPPSEEAAERIWSRNPSWNGTLRTTCVATRIEGGHAENALPQQAKANVNCRILPGTTIEAVQEQLTRLVADPGVRISLQGDRGITAPVPPLTPQVVDPAKRVRRADLARSAAGSHPARPTAGCSIPQAYRLTVSPACSTMRTAAAPMDATSAYASSRCSRAGAFCTKW